VVDALPISTIKVVTGSYHRPTKPFSLLGFWETMTFSEGVRRNRGILLNPNATDTDFDGLADGQELFVKSVKTRKRTPTREEDSILWLLKVNATAVLRNQMLYADSGEPQSPIPCSCSRCPTASSGFTAGEGYDDRPEVSQTSEEPQDSEAPSEEGPATIVRTILHHGWPSIPRLVDSRHSPFALRREHSISPGP
jgi:hypothetical protein